MYLVHHVERSRHYPCVSELVSSEVAPRVEKGWPAMEALAVLMALKVFCGDVSKQRRTKVLVTPTWTDNRSNGAALNKLMTTRYPASAVFMELASHMKSLSLKVQVEWTLCSGNQEADELASGVTIRFSESLRVDVRPENLRWQLLPEAL